MQKTKDIVVESLLALARAEDSAYLIASGILYFIIYIE